MPGATPPAADTPDYWRGVRRVLKEHRHELGGVASRLYPSGNRVGGTGLLCREEWLPGRPVELDEERGGASH